MKKVIPFKGSKMITALLVIMIIVINASFAFAASPESDFTFNAATGTIEAYVGPGGDVVIPAQIGGIDVTIIGSEAFKDNTTINSVIIPENVVTIDHGAFRDCTNLTSVTFPNSLDTIGTHAFDSVSITELYLPEGVESIGFIAFDDCADLVKIELPSTLHTIISQAFNRLDSLQIIYIPDTVTNAHDFFIDNLSNDFYAVVCRQGSAADTADISPLMKIYLDETDFTFDSSTGTITGYTGSNTNVFIPAEIGGVPVTSIKANAFEGNTSFEHVGISDTIRDIGDAAFKDCPNLKTVFISESVESIGTDVFSGCVTLEEIQVHKWNNVYQSQDGVLFNVDKTTLVRYPEGKTDISYTIPSSVTSVVGYAFVNCDSLESITIHNNVTSLGEYAFYGCDNLKEATLSNGLSEIPDYTFADCVSLGTNSTYVLDIPNSVTRIGQGAFKNCIILPHIKMSLNLERIEAEAFMNCGRVYSVQLTEDIVFIGDNAFNNCDSLEGIVISSKTVTIGNNAFADCDVLSSASNVGLVGYRGYNVETYANANSIKFTPIFKTFNTSTGELDDYIGYNKHLVIPSTINVSGTDYDVKTIKHNAIIFDDELISIEIEEGIISFEYIAIGFNFNLKRIDLPNSITSIAEEGIFECSQLERITIPAGITDGIHANAINGCDNVKIYGYSGTYADQYANDNSIPFVSLGSVTGVSIDTQPTKMTYVEGETLDLTGLIVTLTFSDATTVNVDFDDFSVYGITTSPEHGDVLGVAHNNTPVTVTCNGESATTDNLTVLINGDAETPNITEQPDDVSCNIGDTETVSVTASVSDGGTLSYQWYSNTTDSNSGGSLISGATLSSYTVPTTSIGTTYYYCIITNTNSYVTGNTTATTTSDTTTVLVSAISVTGIEFTNSYQSINISVTDTLVNICPYTITPSDATNTNVTWQSSNPGVASISGNMITAHMVGRTIVAIATNDGGYTDTMVVEVIDTDTVDTNARYGYITGTLVDGRNGNPLPNYTITLYSDPISTTTNSNGEFKINSIPFMDHTLVVNSPSGIEVGRFALNISSSGSSGVSIDNTNNIADITYTSDSIGIELALSLNGDLDVITGDVILALNPKTGDDNSYWEVILLIVLVSLATCIILSFYLKKKLLIKK